jgi:DNA-binding transcriptional regulator of glucitol operon
VLRLVLSPRWILWHLLTLGAMVTCGLLAAWQWHRAGSAMGSAINVGYGLQWPLFALFFGVMWWRFLRMELRELRVDQEAAPAEPAVAEPGAVEAVEVVKVVKAFDAASDEPSPFRRPPPAPPVRDDEDPELAAYNRMLAQLAARDRAE